MSAAAPIDRYVAAFERNRERLAPAALPWLAQMRSQAIEQFGRIGFPGAKNEDWKYTNPRAIARTAYEFPAVPSGGFRCAAVEAAVAALPAAEDAAVIVFVNGRFAAEYSRGLGAHVGSIGEALARDPGALENRLGSCLDVGIHGFAALNAAFSADGTFVHLPKGKALDRPVHILHYASATPEPVVAHVRNLIVAEAGSVAAVAEHYAGDEAAANLVNVVTEVVLERDARLDHVVLQREPAGTSHIARIEVRQHENSNYRSQVLTLGGALSRSEIRVRLEGERAECELLGVYALDDEQHADHHTVIDHVRPYTNSIELYKGVVDGDARGVFTGRIIVRPDSQHIEARQNNNNLLLSENAVAEARPQLEIYADDVKCTHGCTVGQLDETSMFYLRQRGIDEDAARRLLTTAFAGEIIETIADAALRESAEAALAARLSTEIAVLHGIEAT